MTAMQLPPYPTTQKPGSLIAVQSTLQRCVSSTAQCDSETYITTYAAHRAYATLQNVVWRTDTRIPEEITQLTLLIAQRTTRPIAIHTLIDLSIVYAHSPYLGQLQLLFQAQHSLYPLPLTESITNDAVPTLTRLLANSDAHQALASKRKISESILSLLRACSPILPLIRPFSLSKDFILALASLYDAGLTSIAKSYGGYRSLLDLDLTTNDADDWPHIWIQTKIALIDSFHIVLTALFNGQPGEIEKEHIFDTLFALLDLRVVHAPSNTPSTPFLDLPLIADYHHAYNLLEKLPSIFNKISSERDPRLDLLESSLSSLLSGIEKKNPGVLNTVLHSKAKSGGNPIPPPNTSVISSKEITASLDSKTAQILAILPHLSPSHVTQLLRDDRFGGNVERILEGLLDGSLGSELDDVDEEEERRVEGSGKGKQKATPKDREKDRSFAYDVSQRRNIFDNEELDVARVRVGKQNIESHLFQDRSTIERMKWDILQRVEEMEEAEAELLEDEGDNRKEKEKLRSDTAYDEDEIAVRASRIRLLADEESDADSSDDSDTEPEPLDPETVIEQAYLQDPSVFDRDANTRRGKARIELRNLTGWADEQIEGWKVILERTPGKKARLEEKHAFSGNVKGLKVHVPGPSRSGGYRGRGRGGVRGDNGGESSRGFRRGGRGGRGGGGSNRKRGHDKKIAKAGGIG